MKLLLITGIISAILFSACARPKDTRYYLLDYVPTPKAERLQRGPWPVSVRIKDFAIAEAYRRNQIVYRQSAHEMRFYNYELWAVKPEYLVSDMLFRHLRDATLFRELTRTVDAEEAEYTLRGEVTALEEYDNDAQWYAHLALSMQLQETKTQTIVWARTWDYRKKVMQQEPVFVVRELSTLLEKIVEEAVDELDGLMQKKFEAQTADSLVNDSLNLEKPDLDRNEIDSNQVDLSKGKALLKPTQAKIKISPIGDMRQQDLSVDDLPTPQDLPPPENP